MSYMDEYNKLKKKRLEEKAKTSAKVTNSGGSSYMNEYNRLSGQSLLDATTYSFLREPITLSKKDKDEEPKTKKEKEAEAKEKERRWLKKGAFQDGYQFGDLTKTVVGTVHDVNENITEAVFDATENLIDTTAYGVGMVGSLFDKGFKDDVGKFIAKEILTPKQTAEVLTTYANPTGWANLLVNGGKTEENSVFGDKSDGLVQSGSHLVGSYALQMVGVPAWLTMGVNAFGGEIESAFKQDATFAEAGISGGISAVSEVIFEKLSGGIKFGGKALDEGVQHLLKTGIKNKVGRTIAKYATDMVGEGAEEVLTEITSAIGRKLTYLDEKEWNEILSKEDLFDAFIGGAVMSGALGGGRVAKSVKTGRDYTSGLTANEEQVVNKLYEEEVAKRKENGELKIGDKAKIYDDIVKRMGRGDIDTDTIESVLGGESYKGYQSMVEQETSLKEEIEALENTPETQFTVKQRERLTELRDQLENLDTKTAKANLFSEVDKLTANDTLLRESYNEKARRGQAFEADLTKYDAKQQETIKKAVESGILNNTNRTHEFVDLVAKVSADKGVLFDFTNNQKLKDSGFAIDGKQVNGFVTKDGVTLNVNSAKSLDTVVGHEITHVLEGTDLYNELQTAIVEYAKSKGDYQGRYDALTKLYENIEGANIDSELTAELVGDYIFTDTDFIHNLSTNHRNVFQKVYDEIKYLYKVATAGSKEARELERVKKLFDEAYRNGGQAQKNTADSGVKYDITALENGNVYVTASRKVINGSTKAEQRNEITNFFSTLLDGKPSLDIQTIEGDVLTITKKETATKARDDYKTVNGQQIPMTDAEFTVKMHVESHIDEVAEVSKPVSGKKDNKNHPFAKDGFTYRRAYFEDFDGQYYEVTLSIGHNGTIATVYNVGKIKGSVPPSAKVIAVVGSKPLGETLPNADIPQKSKDVNPQFSLSQSEGIDNGQNLTYNGIRGEAYVRTDEFRNLQAESQRMSDEDTELYHSGSKQIDDEVRERLSRTFGLELRSADSKRISNVRTLLNPKTNNKVNIAEGVDGSLFHDVFEISRNYLRNGELVDLHTVETTEDGIGYNDCYNYLSEDGLSGFSITPDGDLISVFNLNTERGFLKTIAPIVTEKAKTLDCYASPNQNLMVMYEKIFGFKTASIMDYNMEYDHDNIAENHSMPKVAFMVNTDSDVELREFTKDQYDEAVEYRNSFVNQAADSEAASFMPKTDDIAPVKYSISEDSNGNGLSPAVQKRFAKSKVVDDDGNLKVVYHGTPGGEFTIFDKTKGSVEGDFGSGFYFTDNASDVERNYEGGGPDFENKVARRAERIYGEEDVEYSEAEARAREELYVGSNKFEVYLNIENPAVVGETTLFDPDSYYEQYSQEDYDSEDDYLADVEQLIVDDIDNIIWEIERNVDVYSTDGISDVLWGAFNEGGIDVEGLKKRINNLYLEDSNGNLVGNEVTRQIIESLGYDGIIDNTVSTKFNMGLSEDTTHYIVFKPNQIKNVSNQNPTDNPDINLSLSEKDIATTGKFLGKDIALETAPVAETTEAVEADVAPTPSTISNEETVEDYAPGESLEEQLAKADETLESLDSETEALFRDYKEQKISDAEFQELYVDLDKRYTQARLEQERLSAEMTDINNRKYESLDDSEIPPEMEAPYYGEKETIAPVDPFAERDMVEVGKRNVKAYMTEHPEVKPYFQDAARGMLFDLQNGIRGERIFNEQLHYESGYEKGWMGTKRRTTSDIADLLDQWGYTYDQIEAGLNAIIEDNGKVNNAISKRIEFMLDNRLRNGYTDVEGRPIPAEDGYINLLKEKQFDDDRRESFDSFMEVADQYAPPAEDIAPLKVEPATEGEQNVLNEFEQTEQEQVEQEKAPERLTRAKLHSQIVDNVKSSLASKGFDLDEVLDNAHRMNALSINDNTPQRVNDKTFGYEAGEALNDLTFNKAALNESNGVKWLNKQVETIRNLSKKHKIKPLSKESAAAQMYAEGFWVNENDEIIAYGDAELAKDFPDVQVQRRIKALANDPTIRKFYDDTLSVINESRTRNAYPEIPRLENYYLHFRAMDDTFSRLGVPFNPNDIKAKDLPTDINGTTIDRKPGQPFFASSMHREGKRTSFDLLGGLEKYANSAKNQIYHIDDIQTTRAMWGYIADRFGQAHGLENLDHMELEAQQEHIQKVYDGHLSNYARFLVEYANNLAGKTALIDRGVEGLIGRRALQFINTVNVQTSRNQVGYSISSPLTNFIPSMEAIARTSKRDSIKAFAQTVANVFRKDGFVESDPTLIRRKGADRFSKTLWEKMSDPGYILMGAVDNVTSEFIVRTKYNELTRKGMDSKQAHIKAGEWASRVMGDRSLGQTPLLYNSKFMGLFTKYQLEVRNALDSQFYDTFQEAKASTKEIENQKAKNAVTATKFAYRAVQIAALNHVFGMAFEKIAGYNPAFDIISTIATLFGWNDDEEDEDTFGDNAEQAFKELLGDLPYTSLFTDGGRIPIGSAMPIKQLISGVDKYGNEKSRLETLAEAAPYYLLPGGYSQIKKTTQGLGMFSEEHPVSGSYTDSGNLRYPVEKTFGNVLQAGLFGQYASENARDYFDNERSPLKEKQIQEYIDVDIPIKDYWEYREGLAKQKTNEDKVDYIDSLDLPLSKKNILVNNVLDRKEDVDLADYGEYGSLEEFDFAVKYPEKYQFLEENGVTFEAYSNADDDAKDAYNWAFQNPDKYTLSKAISDDVVEYKSYTKGLGEIAADKDENGKSINGSRKEKVFDYIESLPLDYGQKCILFKSQYKSEDSMNMDIIEYLDSREDISYEEMVTILTELDFTVNGNNIYWD